MTFRRLYWVTESLDADGTSRVTGVYTSIYDLLHRGLPRHEEGLRLTIAKLDSDTDPIGRWTSPDFEGLSDALLPYVKTEEITEEQRLGLIGALVERSNRSVPSP